MKIRHFGARTQPELVNRPAYLHRRLWHCTEHTSGPQSLLDRAGIITSSRGRWYRLSVTAACEPHFRPAGAVQCGYQTPATDDDLSKVMSGPAPPRAHTRVSGTCRPRWRYGTHVSLTVGSRRPLEPEQPALPAETCYGTALTCFLSRERSCLQFPESFAQVTRSAAAISKCFCICIIIGLFLKSEFKKQACKT